MASQKRLAPNPRKKIQISQQINVDHGAGGYYELTYGSHIACNVPSRCAVSLQTPLTTIAYTPVAIRKELPFVICNFLDALIISSIGGTLH